jgi:hypothetical protein
MSGLQRALNVARSGLVKSCTHGTRPAWGIREALTLWLGLFLMRIGTEATCYI